jgi:hypothetical protein
MAHCYEIQVRGRLRPAWSLWFAGMEVSPLESGDTLLRGQLDDQAALFGLLARIRDLGLTLILVRYVEAEPAEHGK